VLGNYAFLAIGMLTQRACSFHWMYVQILLPISGWKCCLCQHGQTPPPQTGNLAMAMAAMQKAQEKEIPLETSKNFTEQY